MSINFAVGLGRIASDFNKRFVKMADGGFVAVDFSLAIAGWVGGKDGKEETCFIRCEAIGRTAENIVKWFQKGDLIVVGGRLRLNEWTNQAGEKQSQIRLKIEDLGMLPSSCPHCGKRLVRNSEAVNKEQSTPENVEPVVKEPKSDLPF